MVVTAVLVVFYLKVTPKDAGFTVAEAPLVEESGEEDQIIEPQEEMTKGISFWEAFKIPGLIRYSLVFACVKSSNYGLLFWLPDYLHSVMDFGGVKITC